MRLSITTLGCPQWSVEKVCAQARKHGYDGVDFRGIQGELDVTKLPAFTSGLWDTARLLSEHGLATSGISSSIRVCAPEKFNDNLDEARRTMEVARGLGTRNIRVFGEGAPDKVGYIESAKIGSGCVNAILELAGAREFNWNFETHDHWVRSADCRLLLDAIQDPAFGVVWDVAHTVRVGGESAKQTLAALGDRIQYVHIKDAVHSPADAHAMADGWRYVLPGEGAMKLDESIAGLGSAGYDGWLMFEHEKRWHPELEDPDVALPAFVRWARTALEKAKAITSRGTSNCL